MLWKPWSLMSMTIAPGHLLRLLCAYQALKHGPATPSDKGTTQRKRGHLPEQETIGKIVREHKSPLMVVPPLEDLLLPVTTVTMEEGLIQSQTDLTHQTPGTKPLEATEMEEAVEEVTGEEEEEEEEEEEIVGIKLPKTLTLLHGGEPQRNGRSTTS